MTARSRRLAYVLKRFPRISETFVAAEIIELERQGEQVSVFAISTPQEPLTHEFLREIRATVVYLPHRPLRQPRRVARALWRVVRSSPGGWLRAASVVAWPPSLAGWRRLFQATVLCDELAAAGIDHAHAHFATAAASVANLSRRMGGPTYSVTAHAKDIYDRSVRLDRLRRRLSEAEFVATVSTANAAYLRQVVGGQAPIHVIHNSVDVRRFEAGRDAPRDPRLVLSVARLVEKKGLADLIDAAGLLAERGRPIRLEIVGDGPLRRELEDRAARVGATVCFLGAMRYEEVLPRYRYAAVFCLPCVVTARGDRDGLPTSVLEAMASGLPVVATGVNGLSEVVLDGRTGLVVPERDPPAVADAIERLLTDPILADRLAAGGRTLVERGHSLPHGVSALRALFPGAAP